MPQGFQKIEDNLASHFGTRVNLNLAAMEADLSLLNTTRWMNLTAFSGKLTSRID
jgi:hypothetical protein